MITKIEALNYRCFRYISQELGNFHILAGSNASGKSTFLDVIALISDVLNDGPLEAVRKRAPDYRSLFWMGKGTSFEVAIEASIPETARVSLKNKSYDRCRYELSIGTLEKSREIGIRSERLCLFKSQPRQWVQEDLFPRTPAVPDTILQLSKHGRKALISKVSGGKDTFHSETGRWVHVFRLGPEKSALANLPEDEDKFPVAIWFRKALCEGTQLLALNSAVMRKPSPPAMPRRMLPDGSNLPWVLRDLRKANKVRFEQWVRHMRTALPGLGGIRTVARPEDQHCYIILTYEDGLKIPSWVLSDGTLRLLALTVLPYLENPQGIFLIEEPENGIHPKALEAVHDSLSSVYAGQVLLATHSPIFLTITDPSQVLCFAVNDDGAADVIEGSRHPRLRDWRRDIALGDLFAAGVLG